MIIIDDDDDNYYYDDHIDHYHVLTFINITAAVLPLSYLVYKFFIPVIPYLGKELYIFSYAPLQQMDTANKNRNLIMCRVATAHVDNRSKLLTPC